MLTNAIECCDNDLGLVVTFIFYKHNLCYYIHVGV